MILYVSSILKRRLWSMIRTWRRACGLAVLPCLNFHNLKLKCSDLTSYNTRRRHDIYEDWCTHGTPEEAQKVLLEPTGSQHFEFNGISAHFWASYWMNSCRCILFDFIFNQHCGVTAVKHTGSFLQPPPTAFGVWVEWGGVIAPWSGNRKCFILLHRRL